MPVSGESGSPSPPPYHLDRVTEGALRLLLNRRPFLSEWERRVAAAMADREDLENREEEQGRAEGNTPVSPIPDAPNHPQNRSPVTPLSHPGHKHIHNIDRLAVLVSELVRTVDASTQTFLTAVPTAFFHFDPADPNRDASAHFSVRLLVDRLVDDATGLRAESCTRRLIQLTKLFPTRIVSSIHVPNTLWFSSSLCDMLFSLEEQLRIIGKRDALADSLFRCASDFNEMVVGRLDLMSKRHREKSARSPSAPSNQRPPRIPSTVSPLTASAQRRRCPLLAVQPQRRQATPSGPGFLMTPELVKDRQRIVRTRSCTPKMLTKSPQPSTSSHATGSRRRVALSMERKWASLLTAEPLLRQSAGAAASNGASRTAGVSATANGETLRIAREMSARVVREVRKKIGSSKLLVLDS